MTRNHSVCVNLGSVFFSCSTKIINDCFKLLFFARFVYTHSLKAAYGGFYDHHFTLSSDPMRVATFESLNNVTDLMRNFLGGSEEFERVLIHDILWRLRNDFSIESYFTLLLYRALKVRCNMYCTFVVNIIPIFFKIHLNHYNGTDF